MNLSQAQRMFIPAGEESRCPICGAEAVPTAGGKRTAMVHDLMLHRLRGSIRDEPVRETPRAGEGEPGRERAPRRASWTERYD